MTRRSPRSLLLLALLSAALALTACGSDEETAATPAPTPTPTPTATPDLTDLSVKPVIAKPAGDPPTELVKRDIVVGKGRAAKAKDLVTVKYVGASYSTGEEFDTSWDKGQDFPFTLGAGDVIEGWDEGIPGMRKGGRRELVIPAAKAYGEAGSPPAIAPGETLIFIVDMVEIQPG